MQLGNRNESVTLEQSGAWWWWWWWWWCVCVCGGREFPQPAHSRFSAVFIIVLYRHTPIPPLPSPPLSSPSLPFSPLPPYVRLFRARTLERVARETLKEESYANTVSHLLPLKSAVPKPWARFENRRRWGRECFVCLIVSLGSHASTKKQRPEHSSHELG